MSHLVTDDPRCLCAHRLSEHTENYGLPMCRGHVLAVDETTGDGPPRSAPCGCRGFAAAPGDLLSAWGDLPLRPGASDALPGAVAPREGIGGSDVAPRTSVAGDDA